MAFQIILDFTSVTSSFIHPTYILPLFFSIKTIWELLSPKPEKNNGKNFNIVINMREN